VFITAGIFFFRIIVWTLGLTTDVKNYCYKLYIVDYLVLGLCFLSSLLSYISLFSGLSIKVHLLIVAICFVTGARLLWQIVEEHWKRRTWRGFWVYWAGFGLFLPWAVYRASKSIGAYDTGTYHLQSIRWIKEYGTVPGLANLFGQLGFNSQWHVLWAAFDHGPFANGLSYHLAGLIPFVVLLLLYLNGLVKILEVERAVSGSTLISLLGFVGITYYYKSHLSSLSTDLPAAALALYCVQRFMNGSEIKAKTQASNYHAEFVAFVIVPVACIFVLTIKLSLLPLMLLAIFAYRNLQSKRWVYTVFAAAALVGFPYFLRNIVLTGYLLYPIGIPIPMTLDWKVPIEDLFVMRNYIREFPITTDRFDVDIAALNLAQKITLWILNWNGTRVQLIFAWLVISLAFCCVLSLLKPVISFQIARLHCTTYIIVMTGLIFCILTAPEPRFLGAWAIPLSSVASAHSIVVALMWRRNNLGVLRTNHSFIAGMLVLSWILVSHTELKHMADVVTHFFKKTSSSHIVGVQADSATFKQYIHDNSSLPPIQKNSLVHSLFNKLFTLLPVPKPELVLRHNECGVGVWLPKKGNRLYYGPLPAAQRLHPYLNMRGVDLRYGFRVTAPSGWTCLNPRHEHPTVLVIHDEDW
jgi:hypothetical protein